MPSNKILIALFVIIAGILIAVATTTSSSTIYSPKDIILLSKDKSRVRIVGKVVAESIVYITDPNFTLTFYLKDREQSNPASKVKVIYKGIKPDMFAAERDVLVDGDYKSGEVQAVSLLTQCPSKYEPVAPTQ